jgi:Lrp/AsnC family transcriptional regulator, regulator for asnA, asnC and gidA
MLETAERYKLDEVDRQILKALQKDGRVSFSVLASKLGIAVSTVSKRYQKLSEEGFVKIIGRVEPSKIDHNAYSCIFIKINDVLALNVLATNIANLPEVSFVALRTGEFDIEVNAVCKDNEHLLAFTEKIHQMSGVQRTETHIYLKVFKWGLTDVNI